ncbi:MAG: 2-phosphosulfolactate phosphatase [Bacteroidota bacterium]|nr:2-phosphosulfolactate phosphatase [Bacteroidota bacterium]
MFSETNIRKKGIEVCFSPALFPFFNCHNKIVVIVDILRATSVICSALDNGVKTVKPVAEVEEAFKLREAGYLVVAERNGMIVEGADLGNTPLIYTDGKYAGKSIALTTTNGTKAIEVAKGHENKIIIGSFLNFSTLVNWLTDQDDDILILCAGWKNHFNLEDTVFAGAVIEKLINSGNFSTICDSAIASLELFYKAKNDIFYFIKDSSHFKRLEKLNLIDDIKYCLSFDKTNVLPILRNGDLGDLNKSN